MRFLRWGKKVQGNASETRGGCHRLPRKAPARSVASPRPWTPRREGGRKREGEEEGERRRERDGAGAGTREAGGGFEFAPGKVLMLVDSR